MKVSRFIALVLATCILAACRADELPPTERYATFKGVVLDSVTSQPVANATVTVDTVLTTTTAADGSFSFANVPSGDIDYVVTLSGYQSVSEHVHADPSATATVTVKLAPGSKPGGVAKAWKFALRVKAAQALDLPMPAAQMTRAARSHAR